MDRHEQLCTQRDDAAEAEDKIVVACRDLKNALIDKVQAFCKEHDADFSTVEGYILDMVSDIEFDACGPHYRRRADRRCATRSRYGGHQ